LCRHQGGHILPCLLGLQEKTDWDAAKRVMSDAAFITRLIEVRSVQQRCMS
jgi:hypothetical protein